MELPPCPTGFRPTTLAALKTAVVPCEVTYRSVGWPTDTDPCYIGSWDTSQLTSMEGLGDKLGHSFNEDLGDWDTAGVTTFSFGEYALPSCRSHDHRPGGMNLDMTAAVGLAPQARGAS